jgi:hydroxymethylpyrimidine/phosphomethylpyrimidine kinase
LSRPPRGAARLHLPAEKFATSLPADAMLCSVKTRRAAPQSLPVALSIAGSDSGASAGVQADLLTFAALGVFGTTAITCLTAQNPTGVAGVHEVPANFVAEQCREVAAYFRVRAAKTGMLFSASIITAVAEFLRAQPRIKLVVDPVMVATSGAVLLQPEAIAAMKSALLPRATVVTPNLDEAGVLLGLGRKPSTVDETIESARALASAHGVPFLVKGGHLAGDQLVDVLARPRGAVRLWRGRRVHDVDTHGSGCTLSAAIVAGLAHGFALERAVDRAHAYLRRGITRPLNIAGRAFIAHR